MYELVKCQTNNTVFSIRRLSDGASIPDDPANTDYQQYLAWVEEGNVAEEWNPDQPSDTIEEDS